MKLICSDLPCLVSGEKISPIEVDAVLLSHADIAQAVAFGVPDEKYGEEVRKTHRSILNSIDSNPFN